MYTEKIWFSLTYFVEVLMIEKTTESVFNEKQLITNFKSLLKTDKKMSSKSGYSTKIGTFDKLIHY